MRYIYTVYLCVSRFLCVSRVFMWNSIRLANYARLEHRDIIRQKCVPNLRGMCSGKLAKTAAVEGGRRKTEASETT